MSFQCFGDSLNEVRMISGFHTGMPEANPGNPQGTAHFTAALLQATLSARKVTAIVSLTWDGPQMWVYAASLGLGEDPEKVERLRGALALAAGADTCRIARDRGRLLIEIPKPEEDRAILRADRLDRLQAPHKMAVPLGIPAMARQPG